VRKEVREEKKEKKQKKIEEETGKWRWVRCCMEERGEEEELACLLLDYCSSSVNYSGLCKTPLSGSFLW
jgi:hypothetical protein